MRAARSGLLLLALLWMASGGMRPLHAGGPLAVGSPVFGIDGAPFRWDVTNPIPYRTDGGMLGPLTNEQAVARVNSMFAVWEAVPAAAISYTHAGSLLPTTGFSDGDVSTLDEYDAVSESCFQGEQNPVSFDADGSIFEDLFGPGTSVLGIAGACLLTSQGRIGGGDVLMNGAPLLNGDVVSALAISDDSYDAAIIHEIGHFSGLDHAQINLNFSPPAPPADQDGVPTMFPFLLGEFQKSLSPDDISWIASLYPKQPEFDGAFGRISGRIFMPNGSTHVPGVNVIARRLEMGVPSRSFAISVISGFLFHGGDVFGSHNPDLEGFYEFALPAGQYTVEVEKIHSGFVGGSGIGPFPVPLPLPGDTPEFWSGESESHDDDPSHFTPIVVTAGSHVTNINIILNGEVVGVKRRRGQLVSE
jgi:hypothetical protein